MNTVITHFYNEEYLLPWWLTHHKQMFDHGILIDYASTDRSCDIIKEICPHWQIIQSQNKEFGSLEVDDEIYEIEKSIEGWRIALTITEFLTGNMKVLENKQSDDLYIESILLIDEPSNFFIEPDPNKSLLQQRTFGVYPPVVEINFLNKGLRRFSKFAKPHRRGGGRHYFDEPVDPDFLISCCLFSPYTDAFVKRKMQIQTRIPQRDKDLSFGWHHLVTREMLDERLMTLLPYARDISNVYKEKFNKIII